MTNDIDQTAMDTYMGDPDPFRGMTLVSAYHALRPTEKMFVDAYLQDMEHSATQAGRTVAEFVLADIPDDPKLRRAAIDKRGKWYASSMMQKSIVRAAITERVNELTRKMEVSAYNVLKEVAGIARASVGDFITIDPVTGLPKWTIEKATPDQLATVQSIKVEYDRDFVPKKVEIKLHDKLAALDKLMRYLGMFNDDKPAPAMSSSPGGIPQQGNKIAASTTTAEAADMYARMLSKG